MGGVYAVFRESVNRGAIDAVEFLQVCQGERSAESITMRVFDPFTSPHRKVIQVIMVM